MAVVKSSMKSVAKKLSAMTGGVLETALGQLGCPALMVAIKAGIAGAFPGIIIPGCVSKWFTGKCKDTVKSAFKRARLLRRLTAIRREIQKF
jgi:phosphomannomutase